MSFKITIRANGQVLPFVIFWGALLALCCAIGAVIQWTSDGIGFPSGVGFWIRIAAGLVLGFFGQRVWDRREVVGARTCRNTPRDED